MTLMCSTALTWLQLELFGWVAMLGPVLRSPLELTHTLVLSGHGHILPAHDVLVAVGTGQPVPDPPCDLQSQGGVWTHQGQAPWCSFGQQQWCEATVRPSDCHTVRVAEGVGPVGGHT